MASRGLAIPRAALFGVLRQAREESELTDEMVEELGTMQAYWTNTQVHEFLSRACAKGWCHKLHIVRLSDDLQSHLYYDNPYDAIQWLETDTRWTVSPERQLPDVLGVPAEVVARCQEGTWLYILFGDQLVVLEPGLHVGEIYEQCGTSLNLPARWAAHVGSEDVSEEYRSKPGDVIEFSEDIGLSLTGTAFMPTSPSPKPRWDQVRRELTFEGKLIKHYRQLAPNQVLVLAAFEEDGWPVKIDDPLPQSPGVVPKRRLRDTVRALNANHENGGLLKFRADGTGQGILWERLGS
jgi:hypothetical protein